MITPRQREREPYDEDSDHHRDRSPRVRDFYDEQKKRKPHVDKFIPRRRGPAKITWPLAPEKALIELTGRHTLARALLAYVHFFNARLSHWEKRLWSSDAIHKMVLDGPWTERVLSGFGQRIFALSAQRLQHRETKRKNFESFSQVRA